MSREYQSDAPPEQRGLLSSLQRFLAPRARLWGYMIPLHLLAFLLLYFISTRLMVNEIITATSGQARSRLQHESAEFFRLAPGTAGGENAGHAFSRMMASHQDVDLRVFLPGGRMIGDSELPVVEHKEMVDFLGGSEGERLWLSDEGHSRIMRALRRVVTTEECLPCHQPGQMLAVISMSVDLSEPLDRVLERGRRNMFLVIVVWATLLTLTTVIVRRSVQQSATRFKRQLEAAGSGATAEAESTNLVLDPTTARLQEALRGFLRDQRKQQQKVASRLAHTDQLASLGRLAAGLAHEIKNPLAGIQGALEILKEDEATEPTKDLYGEMLAELDRVNETLRALLASARPSPAQISANDARKVVEDVQRLLLPSLRRKKIALETEFAAGDIVAPFDAGKIRQVLINLIQNAAEAIEESGTITVSVARCPDGTGVIFVVEDDGPGISEEHQKGIFEPFFTTKFTGTGLGLSITRGLVQQHGGSIQVESSQGEGTTFFVILPESTGSAVEVESDGKLSKDGE